MYMTMYSSIYCL